MLFYTKIRNLFYRFVDWVHSILKRLTTKGAANRDIIKLEQKFIRLAEQARKERAKTEGKTDRQYALAEGKNKYADYDKPITTKDIEVLRSIGRKSVNDFTAEDLEIAQKWAHKFYQQLGEKSPFFRAWLGDWRAYDKTPIKIATQKGDTRGLQKNADTGWDISISRKIFNETSSHNGIANIEAKSYLPFINEIVQNAVLLDTVISNKGNQSLFMHSFYAVADIGNGPEVLKLYVEELNNPGDDNDIIRAYQLQNIEKKQFAVTGSANGSLSRISQTTSVKNIADLFAVVKQKDKNFTPNPVNEHLLNEDGTPKKFYHGTKEKFTEFSKKKAKPGFYGRGFYFTTEKSQSNVYGESMEVFLRIENPLMPGENQITKNQITKFLEAVAKNEDYSIENYGTYDTNAITNRITSRDAFDVIQDVNATAIGDFGEAMQLFNEVNGTNFDGVITPTETVVYDNTQIKSATSNIGTFDKTKSDIRYSLPSVDRYTEKQYNNFGWVRANDVLTAAEYDTLLSRYADYKHNKDSYPVTRFGETVVHSFDYNDVLVYVKGSIKSPEITKVIKINADDYTASKVKEWILQNEYRQVYQPYQSIEFAYGEEIFSKYRQRDFISFQEYRAKLERNGSTKGDTASGTEQDRKGSSEQNKRTGRADPIDGPAYSLPDDSDGVVNQDNNELLDEAYKNTGKTAEREKSVAELKRDVKRLRTLLNLARRETHGTDFDPAKIEKAARGLLRSANSKYDVAALTDELGDLYRYIAKGEDVTYINNQIKSEHQPTFGTNELPAEVAANLKKMQSDNAPSGDSSNGSGNALGTVARIYGQSVAEKLERERPAIKISAKDQKYIKEVAAKLGRTVVFEHTKKTQGFKSDGYIDKNTGIIHIDYATKDPLQFVFKHELTHFLEINKATYSDFANAVMDSEVLKEWVKKIGYDSVGDYRKSIIELYSEIDKAIDKEDTDEEQRANEEMLANFVGSKLFGNNLADLEKLLKAMEPKQRRTFMEFIRDFIKHLKEKLIKDKSLTAQIDRFEKEFIKAYQAAQTEFENNKGDKATDNNSKSFLYVGERARTANKLELSNAKQMLKDGADSETIRKETGWFKGYDGKWRFEISDKDIDINAKTAVPLSEKYRDKAIRKFAKNPDADIRYSLSVNAKKEVETALNNKNYNQEIKLTDGSPSILLAQKGVKNLPMIMNASHIRENIFTEDEAKAKGLKVNKNINYHGLGKDLFYKVIDGLDDVKEAYRGTKNAENSNRRENYFLLISQYTDKDNNIINVPVYINEKGLYNRVFIDANKIATVFGRNEFRKYIREQLSNGNLVRIKNRSTQTSESTSPINADYGKNASKDSIPNSSENVKVQYSFEFPHFLKKVLKPDQR